MYIIKCEFRFFKPKWLKSFKFSKNVVAPDENIFVLLITDKGILSLNWRKRQLYNTYSQTYLVLLVVAMLIKRVMFMMAAFQNIQLVLELLPSDCSNFNIAGSPKFKLRSN